MFKDLNKRFLSYFNKNLGNPQRYTAFTLAEVLITLGIIGIVAAMTIPTLINASQKAESFSKLQKALSVISQASSQIRNENSDSMANLATTNLDLANLFKPYLKVAQFCTDSSDSEKCYIENTDVIKSLDGSNYAGSSDNLYKIYPKIVTNDGFVYIFSTVYTDCTGDKYTRNGNNEYCGYVVVDINGKMKPNTMGKDLFLISINKFNTTPYWDMALLASTGIKYYRCDKTRVSDYNGLDCTYRAIMEGKIDYY